MDDIIFLIIIILIWICVIIFFIWFYKKVKEEHLREFGLDLKDKSKYDKLQWEIKQLKGLN
jgi:hypothetical protein